MTHIPVQLPFKGFTEQASFSEVPQGMTPSCLNVMPSDVWNGRTRIGTRNGTRLYNTGSVQFMGTYRIYEGGVFVEKLIFVRAGIVYYSDPRADLPAESSDIAFGDGTTQATPLLNTTGLVEGVQFNDHFYFVDGDHYVIVHLHDATATDAVESWGHVAPSTAGPYHTDPSTVTAGCRATLICRWGARLVLAGYRDTPNIWYACAPDDPYIPASAGHAVSSADGWDPTKYIGAISGTAENEYGTLSDPIVAIFPFAQSGLMFACTNSFSFLTADPLFEESVNMVSLTRSIGIAGRRAWCQSQEKGAFILANDGLYYINANDFNFNRANRVSAGRLDSFFLRLDFGTPAIGGSSPLAGGTLRLLNTDEGSGAGSSVLLETDEGGLSSASTTSPVEATNVAASLIGGLTSGDVFPCLCYDPDREGVWVFLSVSGVESASLHLYYDLKTDSFWPQRFSDPMIYAPTSASYVGTSRNDAGRLFMGGGQSISVIDREFPIGIDGFDFEMTEKTQRAQFIRSSITLGPVIATIPYRVMLNEVRVDLADDAYELPTGFTDVSNPPIISVTSGDTAQSALGLQTDTLFVINLDALIIDGGTANVTSTTPTYNGGDDVSVATTGNRIDGRFAFRPFGSYTQNDPFASGTSRIYDGPDDWLIRWDLPPTGNNTWTIERVIQTSPSTVYEVEYQQVTPDQANPDGSMTSSIQVPVFPDVKDKAIISGASFPEALVTEIGSLVPGRNSAKKCRIRGEAMYITIASDGRPWSIERMSAVVTQVGKSRGD